MGFEETWADATATTGDSFDDTAPPDGTYDGALMDADAFTSKNRNDLVKLSWQTVDKQWSWDSIHGFTSPQAAGFTKGTCQTIGVDIDKIGSLDELKQALQPFIGGFYEIAVKRNNGFTNTYVNDGAVARTPDVPPDTSDFAAAPGGSTVDDDMPF